MHVRWVHHRARGLERLQANHGPALHLAAPPPSSRSLYPPSPARRPLKGAHVVVPTQEPTLRSLGRQRRSTQQRTGMDEAPTQALPSLGVPALPPLSHHTPISLPAPSGRHVASLGARGKGDGWMTAWGTTTTRSLPPELTARPPPPFPVPPPSLSPPPSPLPLPTQARTRRTAAAALGGRGRKKAFVQFRHARRLPPLTIASSTPFFPPPPPQHSPAEV